MRILVTTQYFYPHLGGSQEVIRQLYSILVKNHKDTQVDLICYNTDNARKNEIVNGINVFRIACIQVLPGQFALPNYWQLFKIICKLKKQNKYDIVNSHTRFFDNSWWSPLVAKYLGAKSVLTDHCASFPVHSNIVVTNIAKYLDKLLIPFITKNYDKLITISHATKKYLEKIGSKKVDRIFINGVNASNFYKSSKKKNKLIVTFLGRMIAAKHPELIMEAAKHFSGQNIDFIFAGDGPVLSNLKSRVVKNSKFLGNINHRKVISLLAKTDILVHPSTHHEGIPISLLEAQAAGVCVLATNVGGVKEIIKDKITGLIIKPDSQDIIDKINYLIKNPKKRKLLSKNAQDFVRKYHNWSNISEMYYQYMLKIANQT